MQQHRLLCILHAVVGSPGLRDAFILRGGAAIQICYGGARPAGDIDFLVLRLAASNSREPLTMERAKAQLLGAIRQHLPIYYGREVDWSQWSNDVGIDLSPCQTICDCRDVRLPPAPTGTPASAPIKVVTLEDILAEKLIAPLIPFDGGGRREQDIFDLADMLRKHPGGFDETRVAHLACRKAEQRGTRFARSSYSDDVRARVAVNYDSLSRSTGSAFIPLNDAWNATMIFLDSIADR